MSNILLVEPDYRSKFPPLGLMRIASYHKERGDQVTFVRGKSPCLRDSAWHRIYVSSLFTYELPRTVETIRYYLPAVEAPANVFVGGIGATLMPEYIRDRVPCMVVEGQLDKPDLLGPGSPPVAQFVPDYSILSSTEWKYAPADSYFRKLTKGCIRRCKFCAVPKLEPEFGYCQSLHVQIKNVDEKFGERQHLVLMDNNILAAEGFDQIIAEIQDLGFEAGAVRNGRKRTVDFNQGIDARLINKKNAELLSSICLSPVRFAFDSDGVERPYRRAIKLMTEVGFTEFTNYVMFNFNDTPLSLYHRLRVNIELSMEHHIRITGFPMRFVPIDDVQRRYVSPGWKWRQLRGIQCILLATHGMVSPNPEFFAAAFGQSYEEFLEILAMPDRYIIYRQRHKNEGAAEWRKLYRKLNDNEKDEFLSLLGVLHQSERRRSLINAHKKYAALLEHYYPTRDSESEDDGQADGVGRLLDNEVSATLCS